MISLIQVYVYIIRYGLLFEYTRGRCASSRTNTTYLVSLVDDDCVEPKRRRESASLSPNMNNSGSSKSSSHSEPISSAKKYSPPNVTVIHPSSNHPMFSYLCHATGNMAAMSAAGYLPQSNYPGLFPAVDIQNSAAAAAATLMNPFLFNQLLRHQLPASSRDGMSAVLSPTSVLQAYSRVQSSLAATAAGGHRFSPYSIPTLPSAANPAAHLPPSLPSIFHRNTTSAGTAAAEEDLKALIGSLSHIKGEV